MKKLLLFSLFFLVALGAKAQTYLASGDYVTIRMTKDFGNVVTGNRYLQASNGGVQSTTTVNDNCLLQMEIINGEYRFRDVTTGLYLKARDNDINQSPLILSNESNASLFRFNQTGGEQGKYMSGKIYYNATAWGAPTTLYLGDQFGVASWFDTFEFCIEKWEKVGGGDAAANFEPADKVIFEYAANDDAAKEQAIDVKFMLQSSSESYYKCVCREEMLLNRQTTGLDITKVTDVKVSWLHGEHPTDNKQSVLNLSSYTASDGETNRTLMTLSDITKSGDNWQFKITPIGKSPMGLKAKLLKETVNGVEVYTEEYVDFVDWAVVSYKYNGKDFTQQLRVVRKAYHEDKLPTLVLTVNPVNWTFGQKAEEKVFDVKAIHQHGSVIYSVENIAIGDPVYETGYKPTEVTLTSTNLTLTLSDNWNNELTAILDAGKIKVNAKENGTGIKRSAVLTGTLCPIKEQDHPCQTFTIDLHQRYVNAGIQLIPNIGKGNTAIQKNKYNRDEQAVHTAERTIYYDDKEAIELRLPESGYSGYMRWYDYETNGAPNYNHCHKDENGEPMTATAWDFAPQSASGKAFAAINTPVDKNSAETVDGYSLGLYALHKEASSDGNLLTAAILDEEQNDNPAPRIRPWSDNGYHIMACDVSAYTDYEIVVENKQIQSITEPTLSYRQLFHMYPASVMADKFAALKEGEFLENYSYQAPAGKQVLLATEYRFHKIRSHISEMCYFYYDKTGTIQRITDKTTVVWKEYILQGNGTYRYVKDITPQYSTLDYLVVQENSYPVQKKYTLTVPAANANTTKDLLIASFEVKYQDIEKYGPTDKIIITQQRIEADYDVLATINFDNYDSYDKHLPWDYTSYGYVYDVYPLNDNDNGGKYKRGANQGVFPFYGEYTIVESVNKDWARSDAHSGKALYVDGTMEPGLVATIAAPTNICSGQTVYCSAWLRNPRPQSDWAAGGQTANPIFRCNIQGRTKTDELDDKGQPIYTEWEDAGVYFVGELAIGSKWQQIVFPIESAHSYDETRVSIYNFATTNQGNDFMVDDINLYVSRLPIAAYQGKMACRSDGEQHTRAAAILRLDYTNINVGDARYMYYQIFNSTMQQPVELEGDVAYYHEAHGENDHSDFGSVGIPDVTFDPEVHNAKPENANNQLKIYYSVSKLLDDMIANNWQQAKAYVKTENSGVVKWLLYVAHLIDQVTDQSDGWNEGTKDELPLHKLYDEHTYVMRMAYTPEELPTAECNLTTPIHATQQTVFTLRNSDKKTIGHTQTGDILTANTGAPDKDDVTYIFKQSYGNCANDLYFLTSTVVNHLAVEGAGGPTDNIAAPIYSDWLIGDPDGDVLSGTPPPTDDSDYNNYLDRLQASIAGFEKKYGYTHGQVSHAIMYDMRRVPTDKEPNPNYAARTFEELDPSAFESLQNYEIVRSLYENGWLQLYDTTVHFYLGSQDTARYWCFPIAETAKATIKVGGKDSVITIKDCNEPHRVMVTSAESEYQLNVAPILKKDKTPQQKLQLPNVNVLANSNHTITSVTIPIKEIAEKVEINSGKLSNGDNIIIDLTTELPAYISFFDLDLGKAIAKPASFEIGEKYTMRLAYQSEGGYLWLGTENASCRVGYIFFTIQVVPNTLVWKPVGTSFNGWGKNENWRGWKDKDGDFVIDEGELTKGFVPMAGSNVVIPNLGNEILYPYIVPEHEHDHYPMTIHHDQHRCENIYFAPGAMIQNQHLLHYERAFVDMPLTARGWHMMSAPLQDMYSGDMFIPHSGGKSVEYANPFEVSKFRGKRSSTSTYAFWASYYNQTVNTWYDNGTTTEVAAAAEFHQSNGLNQALLPASGYLLWGEGKEKDLVVRLPKPDKVYYSSGGNQVSVQRTNSGKFAFTATHENQQMNITLTNKVESEYFVFGNPTMAYINMAQFLQEHSSVLTGNVYRIDNGSWTATAEQTMRSNEKYLAPMTSVMLEAIGAEQTSLNLTLTPSVLTLNDQVAAQSPVRRVQERHPVSTSDSDLTSEILTIYAITPNAHARTLIATHPEAYDYYVQSEDALLMTSGVQTSSYVTIPLNLYTAAEQVPMMADVRQGVSRIPLSMIVYPEYRTEYMQLAFYLTNNWTRECYILDSYTGQKIRIMDGLLISVPMPKDYEERYFIEGPDEYLGAGTGNGDGTTTNLDNATTAEPMLRAYSVETGQLTVSASQPIRDMKVYSITGQLLYTTLANCQLSTIHCQVPSGACIVEAKLHSGNTLHQQAIVK